MLDALRSLRPLILAHREQLEAERRLPAPLVEALNDAGLFRMWLPAAGAFLYESVDEAGR